MGMFDTVYVDGAVVAAWRLRCDDCGRPPRPNLEWQTKSLDPCMHSYLLRYDDSRVIRMYLLDRPSDRRFWRPWTEEELALDDRLAAEGRAWFPPLKKRGEGHFLPEAYLPENRRQRFMGELPHQWIEIYSTCECGKFITLWIKFTDGVATESRSERPELAPDFFANAGDWSIAGAEDA